MSDNNLKRAMEESLREKLKNNEFTHNLEVAMMASRIQGLDKETSISSTSRKRNSSTLKRPTVLYNATVKPTLEQGDCFFSSIYRASKEQGLLNKINNCNPDILISNEDEFITSLRYLVATNSTDAIRSLYDFLLMLHTATNKNSKNTLKEQMANPQGFDNWHKELIRKHVLIERPNFNRFLTEFKNGIQTRKRYVCDIEILTTKGILENCEINIETHHNKPESGKLYKKRNGIDTIHIYNCGRSHFEYFSLSINRGGRRLMTKKVYRGKRR